MQLAFRPAQRATASAFPLRAPISARPKASRSKASSARREQAPLQLFFVRLVRGKRGRTFTKRWGASANLLFRRAPSNQITARLFRRWASKYAAQAADQTRDTVLKRQLPPFFFFFSHARSLRMFFDLILCVSESSCRLSFLFLLGAFGPRCSIRSEVPSRSRKYRRKRWQGRTLTAYVALPMLLSIWSVNF